MPALGVTVSSRSTPPSRGSFSQTGTWFAAGKADLGPTDKAAQLGSIADFIAIYGARTTANAVFYDSVDTAFQEGVAVVWASRVVGPSAAVDTINLAGASGTSLVWTASYPGPSGVKLQVTNGVDGTTRIVLLLDAVSGATIASTAQFSDKTASPPLGTLGSGVLTAGGGSGLPVVAAATAPSGGSSDLGNATSTELKTATDKFLKRYGPGNISAPGITFTGAYNVLQANALANDRFALFDLTDTATTGTLATDVAKLTASDLTYGAFFTPWVQVQGINNSPVTRNVPPSAVYASLLSRIDADGNPNRAAIGPKYAPSNFVVSLNTEFDDATVQSLYDTNGINSLQTYYGVIQSRSFRTPVSMSVDPVHFQANAARLRMYLTAVLGPVGLQYYGEPNDGDGTLEAAYGESLMGELAPLVTAKAIYGLDTDNPYSVSTTINTPTTIALGELLAVVTYTPSSATTSVQIQLAPIPIGG